MWKPIYDGTTPLWVNIEECYLTNGELAFVNERISRPLPSWFGAPTASTIRYLNDTRDEALERFETRSMRGAAEDVVAFYKDRIYVGGLSVIADPVAAQLPGRCCPGFSAENAHDRFSINVYQWQDLAFWTTRLSHPDRRRKADYAYLYVVRRTSARVTLGHSDGSVECWAPTSAITDSCPFDPRERLRRLRRREPERIPWSQLPAWLQFAIPGRISSLVARGDRAGEPIEWEARTVLSSNIDPYSAFNACLGLLDSHGFDPTGGTRQVALIFFRFANRGKLSNHAFVLSQKGKR
jgi:hypothetical protein